MLSFLREHDPLRVHENVTRDDPAVSGPNIRAKLVGVLSILADENINVIDMLNKSRGEVAYNLIDIGSQPSKAVLTKMHQLEGVINVRLIGDCAS